MDSRVLKRCEKWVDFMDCSSDVNTIIVINNEYYPTPKPWPYQDNFNARIDWHADEYLRKMERLEYLHDDSVPHIEMHTGTEIFAQAFGCKVHKSGDNMPFALHAITTPEEAMNIAVPKVMESPLADLFEFAHRVRQKVGNDNILALPDIQSPLDIAALIWEKSEFLMALITDPDAVKILVKKTQTLLTEFLDLWFKEFGTKYIAHYPNYYMEGGFTFSEDEVGEFNSEMFREFCLDSINELSERYGGCGLHCCANSEHQWENFKDIKGLRFLNLSQPENVIAKTISKLGMDYAYWSMYGPKPPQEVLIPAKWAQDAPKAAHIVLSEYAKSKNDAIEMLKKLREFEQTRK